jgi:hypothetical protein
MKKTAWLILILLLHTLDVFSQAPDSGYVITNNRDTIWRKFKDDMMSKKVKIIINGKLKKYEVTELLGYRKGSEINKRFTNDLYMAELEIAGRINFYGIHAKGEYGFDQYFVEKDGNSCEVDKRTLKTTITDWLKDYACDSPLLKEKVNFKNIEKIIKEYNRCSEANPR